MTDIAALKEAAGKATPGPWNAELDSCAQCEKDGTEEFYFYPGPSGGNHATITGRKDAEFIALANPSTILSVIARMEALEEALRGIKWKSADRDNMEFAARITCYQKDAIDAALAISETPGGET